MEVLKQENDETTSSLKQTSKATSSNDTSITQKIKRPVVSVNRVPMTSNWKIATIILLVALFFSSFIVGVDTLADKVVESTDPHNDLALTRASSEYNAAIRASLPSDHPLSESIADIGNKLVSAIQGERRFSYHFYVVNDDTINAFAFPGGEVFINLGLLRHFNNSDQIAAVLAHEIIHVEHRHGMRNIYKSQGRIALYGLIFGIFADDTASVASALSILKYGRAKETESDLFGAQLMSNAGYSQDAMVQMLNKLGDIDSGSLAWLSDHPDPKQRARRVAENAIK